jgi:hypothetical protein
MGLFLERKTSLILTIIFVFIITVAVGCSSNNSEDISASNSDAPISNRAESKESETSSTAGSDDSAMKTDLGTGTESSSDAAAEEPMAMSDKRSGDVKDDRPVKNEKIKPQQIQSGLLTAGEWSDLKNWDWWMNLMNNKEWANYQDHWGFTTYQRVNVVVQSEGEPVADAKVSLSGQGQNEEWTARTNNRGEAYLFTNIFGKQEDSPYSIEINTAKETKIIRNIEMNQDEPIVVELGSDQNSSNILDLMFVVDTTGSMGDELEYLAEELKDVIQRVKRSNDNNLNIRLSTNFYRDQGDDYVTRSFDFTSDVDRAIKQINDQSAAGGGDYEEAVEEALEDAIQDHQWSLQAKARLLFLVLDAPPHHTEHIIDKLQDVTAAAAEQGIRIIPVASSGVDKDTEFLMRFMSITTGGTYVFLTNDSGIGNAHIEPTIGQYEVEMLNDLLVRVVNEYVE